MELLGTAAIVCYSRHNSVAATLAKVDDLLGPKAATPAIMADDLILVIVPFLILELILGLILTLLVALTIAILLVAVPFLQLFMVTLVWVLLLITLS
jgi:hypothetical protein